MPAYPETLARVGAGLFMTAASFTAGATLEVEPARADVKANITPAEAQALANIAMSDCLFDLAQTRATSCVSVEIPHYVFTAAENGKIKKAADEKAAADRVNTARNAANQASRSGSRTIITKAPPPTSPPPPPVVGSKAEIMSQGGIEGDDQSHANFIFTLESGTSNWPSVPGVTQPGGRCIGIGQNCKDKNGEFWLVKACPQWQTDLLCQIRRFSQYARDRYGGWSEAAAFKRRNGWW